jgi:hypothetical protein
LLPLSVACARICIKNFTAATLIVQLPQTLSTALIIHKFLDYCIHNNIKIQFEKPLHTINLKPLYNSLYKNLEIDYISVKRICFLILLINESKSINCYKQSLDFTKKTRAKRFYFGLKRNQVIKVNQGHCLIDLFRIYLTCHLKAKKIVYCQVKNEKVLELNNIMLTNFDHSILKDMKN